jgi:chemotaxis protein methyltransferase CheR
MRSARPFTEEEADDLPQMQAILDTVYERTGIDFRQYSATSIRRRIRASLAELEIASVAALHEQITTSDLVLSQLVERLTLQVTAMFRDPRFYAEFRAQAIPLLRTHPFIRLWVAGCSTGQEVYSLAILLHEEGLYERARIYATDVQPQALDRAKAAVYPIALMQDYTRNYQAAGGTATFSEYYTADGHGAIVRPFLRSNVVFGLHNLVTDGSFNEFHVIFCRNVMIYFNDSLQARVHHLLYDSLAMFGYLGLGRGETIRFSPLAARYQSVSSQLRLYRKVA